MISIFQKLSAKLHIFYQLSPRFGLRLEIFHVGHLSHMSLENLIKWAIYTSPLPPKIYKFCHLNEYKKCLIASSSAERISASNESPLNWWNWCDNCIIHPKTSRIKTPIFYQCYVRYIRTNPYQSRWQSYLNTVFSKLTLMALRCTRFFL